MERKLVDPVSVENCSAFVTIVDALRDDVVIILPNSVENVIFLLASVEVVIVDVTFILFAVISGPVSVENFNELIVIFEPTAVENDNCRVLIADETYNVESIDTYGVEK